MKWSGVELNHRHTDFQSVAEKSQPQQKQTLIANYEQSLQTSLQNNPETVEKQALNLPNDLAEIVAAWPELPEHIRAAIKALANTHIKPENIE